MKEKRIEEELEIITAVQEAIQNIINFVNDGHVVGIQAQIFMGDGSVANTWTTGDDVSLFERLGALEVMKNDLMEEAKGAIPC